MKYGFMMMILLVAVPSCCLRKERKKFMPEPMMIEEEDAIEMPYEPMDTAITAPAMGTSDMDTISPSDDDMAIMQDELTEDTSGE
jgi:hypothetical protein